MNCGAIPNPTDRRSLTAPEYADVIKLWRLFVENEELGEGVDIDKILNGEDSQRPPKICMKCCRAYRACSKYHQNIQANIRKAMETLDMVISSSQSDSRSSSPQSQQIPVAKRPRLVSFCADSQQTGSQETSLSPDVCGKSYILQSMMYNNTMHH